MVERGLQDCATLALYSLDHFISTDFANQYKQGRSARFDDCRGTFHPLIFNANIARSATDGPRRGAHGGTRKGIRKIRPISVPQNVPESEFSLTRLHKGIWQWVSF